MAALFLVYSSRSLHGAPIAMGHGSLWSLNQVQNFQGEPKFPVNLSVSGINRGSNDVSTLIKIAQINIEYQPPTQHHCSTTITNSTISIVNKVKSITCSLTTHILSVIAASHRGYLSTEVIQPTRHSHAQPQTTHLST